LTERDARPRFRWRACGSAGDGRRARPANTRGNVERDGFSMSNAASRPCWGSSGSNYRVCGSRNPKGPSARRLPKRTAVFLEGEPSALLGGGVQEKWRSSVRPQGGGVLCARRDPKPEFERSLAGGIRTWSCQTYVKKTTSQSKESI